MGGRWLLWVVVFWQSSTHGFTPSLSSLIVPARQSTTALYMGMSRKARRQQQKQQKAFKGRNKKLQDAIDEVAKGKKKESATATTEKPPPPPEGGQGETAQNEIEARMADRPELSTMYVDEETGIEVIRQGRNVMDVVTRKAIKLSDLGPEYRLAQQFPGVPMDIRQKHRLDWSTCTVPTMIDALEDACMVQLEDGTRGIPKAPSVANRGIDFCLANRDLLGHLMSKTLGKLMMRAAWLNNPDDLSRYSKLLQNYLTIENHISAPFRQMIMDAEVRIGPNFGNLDVQKYCGGEVYERTANYLVLKGMQCTWEKKVRDAEYIENSDLDEDDFLLKVTGDPRRLQPEPDILYELKDCVQVCIMAQKMVQAFCDDPTLYNDDLPVEVRFLEEALSVKGGAALRRFVVEDFCPREQVTPAALREGVRRLMLQLDSMYLDPYADIRNTVDRLARAMAIGTDDERNPYLPYLASASPDSPGFFQTYTFNHHPMSLVRFLDAEKFNPTQQTYTQTSSNFEEENPLAAVC